MYGGNYVLILHTHLPYVLHHGTWPHGSDWVCEAVAECYIPLLNAFHELKAEGIAAKVTIDISPVLCEQLEHPDFAALFESYCDTRVTMAMDDAKYFKQTEHEPQFPFVAGYWKEWYTKRKKDFRERYGGSIVKALAALQDSGDIEIMTCGATHGYFPLLSSDSSIRLQLRAAVANYEKHFGRKPRGVWLPECAYRPSYAWRTYLPVAHLQQTRVRPGIEELVAAEGLEYFVVDEGTTRNAKSLGVMQYGKTETFRKTHGRNAEHPFDNTPMTVYNVASSDEVGRGTAAIFTRDQNIAMQVWSGEKGYPGDPLYLDFHKKFHRSALRYWRVTDNKADMMYKLLYVPQWVQERIDQHAFHFTQSIERAVMQNFKNTSRLSMVCTPFDTELFGHWWFEGPAFVKAVLRGLYHSPYVNARTASEHLQQMQPNEVVKIPESSWGRGGHHEVWMNDEVKYMWEAIYQAEHRMEALMNAAQTKTRSAVFQRVLKQALRELMLLQASDWEFLVSTQSAKDYAEMRFFHHHSDLERLFILAESMIAGGRCDAKSKRHLAECESRNFVFPELKPEWWS